MPWLILFLIVLLFGFGLYFFGLGRPTVKKTTVTIRDVAFRADVADTVLTRTRGLSGREGLAPDEGMLFIFGGSGNYGFWMKDMNFPIDVIWIRDHEIAGVTSDIQPQPGASVFSLKVYYPPGEVDKVLELPAGTAAKHGFTAGDKVSFSEF